MPSRRPSTSRASAAASRSSWAGLVPDDSPAIEAGARSQQLFSVPLTADTAVVERDAAGFSVEEQREIVERAVEVTTEEQGGDEIRFALPILNTKELFPGSEEDGTTAVTHLFFSADVSLTNKVELAHAYADRAAGHYAGVTGPGPARLAQFEEIENALPYVELGTVLAIALVVGLTFRSLGAPLLTLAASGLAFLVAAGVIPWTVERLGASIPEEVEPLVVALTLGIVTDYTIFFLSAGRRELAHGTPRLAAAERACLAVAPIVATAGLIVVAGSAALLVGELEFFRAFGPALAVTAAVSLAVSLTFVPAALALFGRLVFWPTLKPRDEPDEVLERPTRVRSGIAEFLTSRPVAGLVALVTVAGLLAAASGLRHTALGLRLGSGLPADSEVQEAAGRPTRASRPASWRRRSSSWRATASGSRPTSSRGSRRSSNRVAGSRGCPGTARRAAGGAGRRARLGGRQRGPARGHPRRAAARLQGDQGGAGARGAAPRGSAGGGPPAGGGSPHRPDGGRLGHGRGDRRQLGPRRRRRARAQLRPPGALPAGPRWRRSTCWPPASSRSLPPSA